MRWAINTWAFDPGASLRSRARIARQAGFDALEVNLGHGGEILDMDATDHAVAALGKMLDEEGMEVSSICTELLWQYSLGSQDGAGGRDAVRVVERMLEVAGALKANSIVVIPGVVRGASGVREDCRTVWEVSAGRLRELGRLASEYRVLIGVENVYFNNFLMSPIETRGFLDEVDQPMVRAHLDVGNARMVGTVEEWVRTLADYICGVHVKDSAGRVYDGQVFLPPGLGQVDWHRVAKALRDVDYDGFATVEQSFVPSLGHNFVEDLGRMARTVLGEL